MRMDFLLRSLKANGSLLRKSLAALLAAAAAAALLSGVAVVIGGHFLREGAGFSGMNIGVVDESAGGHLQDSPLLSLVSGMQDLSEYCSFSWEESRQTAREKLRSGELSAVIILPDGILEDVLYGRKTSLEILLDPSRPLECFAAALFAESAANLLSSAQSGIYAVLDRYHEEYPGADDSQVVLGINLEYLSWVVNRQSLYRETELPFPGVLSVSHHYLVSAFLCLLFLAAPVCFSLYRADANREFLRRLSGAGGSVSCFLWSKWLLGAGAGVFLLGVFALAAGLWGRIGLESLPAAAGGVLISGIFWGAFGFWCCNIFAAEDSGPAVLLAALFSLSGTFLAGGILPSALLPGALAQAGEFSPFALMTQSLAPVFGAGGDGVSLVLLLLWSALLLLWGFFRAKGSLKGGAGRGD